MLLWLVLLRFEGLDDEDDMVADRFEVLDGGDGMMVF